MADHKMGGWPVFRNNSDAEQTLMTECSITKSPNQRNQVKRWTRHMLLLPYGTPAEGKSQCQGGVFRSFPLGALQCPIPSCRGNTEPFSSHPLHSTRELWFLSVQWDSTVWKALFEVGLQWIKKKSRPCLQEHNVNPQMTIEHFFPVYHWNKRVLGYGEKCSGSLK